MRIPALLQKLEFVGQAEGDRRTYYVFQGSAGYVVASANGPSGLNVSIVGKEFLEAITRRFRGRQVTTSLIVQKSRRPRVLGLRFAALNALYVMVALGAARKLKKHDGKAMVFKIKR
ncbi:MAG: hypothetical protein ACRD24_00405 [Terriglobales bacterium]